MSSLAYPRRARVRLGLRVGLLSRLRRIPLTAWVCALVAVLNGASWSLITPPFQTPDEPAHFAYVQQLVETRGLPSKGSMQFSESIAVVAVDLRTEAISLNPGRLAVYSEAEQRRFEHDLAAAHSRKEPNGVGVSATEPPLYYALEAIPYVLASGGTLLDQIELMRLFSALLAGVSVVFVFLFLREALPKAPWSWTVGAFGVALYPLFGFMSGSINPDALLYTVASATFYCFARAFRRGFTRRRAMAIGAVTAIGLVTKLNFAGMLPGILVGLLALTMTARSRNGRAVYGWLALALGLAASPFCLYVLANVLTGHAALGRVSILAHAATHNYVLTTAVSYTWQLFLPALPGMTHYFHGLLTIRDIWFNDLVGLYGWLDTRFSPWVYDVALLPAALILLACARALVIGRAALKRRWLEVITYVGMALGVMVLVGLDGYTALPQTPGEYAEPRYLLPMIALFGGVLALAVRGVGRRWGPTAGVVIVVLFMAHDVFSQLLVISRFYG